MLSLSIFHQPEVIGQPPGTSVWWGYGLYPERNGDFVQKRMDQCTGAEILEETLRHLRFDRQLGRDHGVIDLHALQPALREQHLAAAQPRRQAARRFQRGRPISDSSASTSRFRRTSRSPSNTPPARRGRRSTACSSAAPRRRPSIRASTIRRRCLMR